MAKTNRIAKIFKWIGGSVATLCLLLALAIWLVPALYKDEIIEWVRTEVNENIDGELQFEDLNLSFWRSLPRARVTIDQVRLTGVDTFKTTTLFSADELSIDIAVGQLIKTRDSFLIHEVLLKSPIIHAVYLANGRDNISIIPEDTSSEPTESSAIKLNLDNISVNNGVVTYQDFGADQWASVAGLELNINGKYSGNQFESHGELSASEVFLEVEGIRYLNGPTISGDVDFSLDIENEKYTLSNAQMVINEQEISMEGWVDLNPEDMEMDLSLHAPNESISGLLSLIPSAYTSDYEQVKTKGSMSFQANIQGTYASSPLRYPMFKCSLGIKDGWVQYPDLPHSLDDIQLDLSFATLDQQWNGYDIQIPKLEFTHVDQPVHGDIKIRWDDNPYYQGSLNGKIDLGIISQAFPLPGMKQLKGTITSNGKFQFYQQDIINQNWQKTQCNLQAELDQLSLEYEDYPLIAVEQGTITMNPNEASIQWQEMKMGNGKLSSADIRIQEPLTWLDSNQITKASIVMNGDYLDANEWLDTGESELSSEDTLSMHAWSFPRVELQGDMKWNKIDYQDMSVRDINYRGRISEDDISIQEFSCKVDRSDIEVNGQVTGWSAWIQDLGILNGNIQLQSQYLDVNPYLPNTLEVEDDTTLSQNLVVERVLPESMNLSIAAQFKNLLYEETNWTNVSANMGLENQVFNIYDFKSDLLGGVMSLAGQYDESEEKPTFNLKYEAAQFEFKELFSSFHSVQKLAPIFDYIDGILNSTIVMEGTLGAGWMPIWDDLGASGFLETVRGQINGFEPVEAWAKQLGLSIAEKLNLQNTRNWINIENGAVAIKPFTLKVDEIDLEVSGRHQIDSDMDYSILARIPRALFNTLPIGGKANQGIDWLAQEAQKKGIPVNVGDFVLIQSSLSGRIKNPKVAFKLVDITGKSLEEAAKDQVNNALQLVKDSLENEAQKRIDKAKDSVETVVNQKVDSIKAQTKEVVNEKVDSLQKKVTEEIKNRIDSTAQKKIESSLDSLVGEDARKKAEDLLKTEKDKINETLKKWDPFKKKKESN